MHVFFYAAKFFITRFSLILPYVTEPSSRHVDCTAQHTLLQPPAANWSSATTTVDADLSLTSKTHSQIYFEHVMCKTLNALTHTPMLIEIFENLGSEISYSNHW